MSQKIAELDMYYQLEDIAMRESFRQAYDNMKILQNQITALENALAVNTAENSALQAQIQNLQTQINQLS